MQAITAAIVDYGLGNLFSVKHACAYAGMQGIITADKDEIKAADVVILPGIGAFGDAMTALHKLDLVGLLQDMAADNRLMLGVCLGLQLLMGESHEFGIHEGLGIIPGAVVRFRKPVTTFGVGENQTIRSLKVPQIGWNRICQPAPGAWDNTPLAGLPDGAYMYFVHSFYAQPADPSVVMATSNYGGIEFCSALRYRNVFACQFHPERSGPPGLHIYQNIRTIASTIREREHA